jgi:hypothetical protein
VLIPVLMQRAEAPLLLSKRKFDFLVDLHEPFVVGALHRVDLLLGQTIDTFQNFRRSPPKLRLCVAHVFIVVAELSSE